RRSSDLDVLPLHLVLGGDRTELLGQDLAVLVVRGERVGVILLQVVAAARDGGTDEEALGGGPAQPVEPGVGVGRGLVVGGGPRDGGRRHQRKGQDRRGERGGEGAEGFHQTPSFVAAIFPKTSGIL